MGSGECAGFGRAPRVRGASAGRAAFGPARGLPRGLRKPSSRQSWEAAPWPWAARLYPHRTGRVFQGTEGALSGGSLES